MTEKKSSKKPGKETVYIDLDDEITSIIDKVENTGEKVVALVLPKRAAELQSIVNMRLLKRAAQSASKNIVLITNDPAILPLAGATQLHVAKNLQSKPHIPPSPVPLYEAAASPLGDEAPRDEPEEEIDESSAKIDYGRSIGELAAGHEVEEPETIPLDDEETITDETAAASAAKQKQPKDKKLKVPNFDKFRLLLGLGITGLVLLIVFIILATSVLPKARITIKTTSLPVSASFSLTADTGAKTLDEEKSVIPAVLQKKDQTATSTVNATGQQNNGDKASGSVNMSAGICSGTVPSDVPAGTGVSTSGLTYITQQKTTFAPVVAGGKCTFQSTNATAIKAQTGGSKYNVSSASFSVSGRSDVSATGSASGGTDNNTMILSQADVDSAKQKITATDTDNFTKEFKKSLDDQGLYVIESTLKLSDTQATPSSAVGSPATTANVTVKITYSVLTVKKDDLEKVVTSQLNKQIDSSKQKPSGDNVLKGLSVSVQSQESPNKAALQLVEETTAVPIIDEADVKKTVGGQKAGDIRSALSGLPGVKEVDVRLSPFWVSKAPQKPGKITVIQEHVTSNGKTSP